MTRQIGQGDGGRRTALQRSQAAAGALSTVARQLRFAKSRRSKMFEAAGLRPRAIDRVFRILFIAMVAAVLVVPNLAAIGYFGFVASDQYASETRFTLRTSEPMRARSDALAEASGMPSALIAQDTQVIANYVESLGMLAQLEEEFDLDGIYGRDGIDWYARLPGGTTIEDRLDYWEEMVDVSLARSGIVEIEIRAFSPQEAHALTEFVVRASETLVNDMNDRIWEDATSSARAEVEEATEQLSATRVALQQARNEAGILTIDSASQSLSLLLTQARGELATLRNEYRANLEVVSEDAPQMRVLAREIEAKELQVEDLRSQIASTTSEEGTLADRSTQFAQLELEQKLAEDRLAASITALEQLQYLSQQQLLYLDPFLDPTLPDGAEYPRRWLWILVTFLCSLGAFGALAAILSAVRTRLD